MLRQRLGERNRGNLIYLHCACELCLPDTETRSAKVGTLQTGVFISLFWVLFWAPPHPPLATALLFYALVRHCPGLEESLPGVHHLWARCSLLTAPLVASPLRTRPAHPPIYMALRIKAHHGDPKKGELRPSWALFWAGCSSASCRGTLGSQRGEKGHGKGRKREETE